MNRSFVLFAMVALVFGLAVGLRLRSELTRGQVRLVSHQGPSAAGRSVPKPRDHVLEPNVAPEEMEKGPARIISLAPSVTEVVCALGLRERLVGRTPYCLHPPGLAGSIPSVGALIDTNFEMIKSLEPDLILATSNSGETISKLQGLGFRCEAIPHETLFDVYTAIARIGELCDRRKTAAGLVAAIHSDLESLRAAAARLNQAPQRVLITTGPLPVPPTTLFVAGPNSYLDTLLGLVGDTNAMAGTINNSYAEIPLETMCAVDPDIVLDFGVRTSDEDQLDLYRTWSQVGQLRAIDRGQVRSLGKLEWLSAGPRVAILLHRYITVLSEFH